MTIDYAAYWNDHARKVGHRTAVTELNEEEYRDLYRDVLKQLGPSKVERMLDYGCGPALLLPIVREIWPRVIYHGVDISQEMIDYCWKHHGQDNIYFQKIPEAWDVGSNFAKVAYSFDFLTCHSVFTHIKIEDAVVLLKTIHRLLIPGGFASISILDEPLEPDANFYGCIERVDYNFRFFQGMLVQAGFSIEKIYRKHQCYFGVRKV